MDDSGEARLLLAAQSGSAEALAEVVRRQAPRVFDFLIAVTGERDAARTLAGAALLEFAERIGSVRGTAELAARAFRGAWIALEGDGWLAGREPGEDEPAFPSLSRRRAAVIDLVERQGIEGPGLATVLGVSPGSADLIRTRVLASAAADLGPQGAQHVKAYSGRRARTASPEALAVILREAGAARPPTVADHRERPRASSPGSTPPARTVVILALALAGLAGLFVAILLAPMSPLALTRRNDGAQPAAADRSTPSATPRVVVVTVTVTARGGAATATASPSASGTGAVTPGGTATPGTPRTPTGTARTATATPAPPTASSVGGTQPPATPGPTRTPTPTQVPPTATPTATATPTVCAPRLQVFLGNPAMVTVPPAGQVVRIFNADTCSGAPFLAVATGWLLVQPTSGAVPAFGSTDLQLSVNGSPAPGETATLTVVGPANEVMITATFSR